MMKLSTTALQRDTQAVHRCNLISHALVARAPKCPNKHFSLFNDCQAYLLKNALVMDQTGLSHKFRKGPSLSEGGILSLCSQRKVWERHQSQEKWQQWQLKSPCSPFK